MIKLSFLSWRSWSLALLCRLGLFLILWCQIEVALADSLFFDNDDDDDDNNDNNNNSTDSDPTRDARFLQESERVNIFQKLKESLGLAIIGCLLVCLSPCLIWKNEGRHVRELARIDYCKNQAVVVQDVSAPVPDQNQCLVHFTGTVQVEDNEEQQGKEQDKLKLASRVPQALVVRRTVYIYQKFEQAQQSVEKDRIGGGETRTTTYSVREDWTAMGPQAQTLPHLTDQANSRGLWDELVQAAGGLNNAAAAAAALQEQQQNLPPELTELLGMHNPNQAPHAQRINQTAHVGGFALSPAIIQAHARVFLAEWQPVPTECLPQLPDTSLHGLIHKANDHILRTFAGDEPQNGDIKVVYEYVPANFDCSFLVQQVTVNNDDDKDDAKFGVAECHAVDEHCFGAFATDLGNVWMVQKGIHDVAEMIAMAKEEEAAMNKMIRIISWILLLAGWIMLFSPFTTALEVLPILSTLGYFAVVLTALVVSAACCSTITLLAYFRYRPILSGALLLVAFGIWGIIIWRLDEAADEGGSVDWSSHNKKRNVHVLVG